MVDHWPIYEPTEAGRPINLAAPFRSAGWTEKDQVLETQQRLGFAIAILLF